MRKLAIGIAGLALLVVFGYAGATWYAQKRADREISAVFDAIRAGGAQASYGQRGFQLWSRTLRLHDIAIDRSDGPATSVKIGAMEAQGVSQPEAGRLAAKRIEITDIDVSVVVPIQDLMVRLRWTAPRLELDDVSGPAGPLRRIASGSALDLARLVLEHVVATSAGAVRVPSLRNVVAVSENGAARETFDYRYTGIELRNVRGGRVPSSRIARVAVAVEHPTNALARFSGEMADVTAEDTDLQPLLAALDPAGTRDEGYRPVYRRAAVGRYSGRSEEANFELDSITLDSFALNPAKLRVAEIVAVAETMRSNASPSPEAVSGLFDLAANLYESMRMGRVEMRGLSLLAQPTFEMKLSAIRLDKFESGRIEEFSFEGIDLQTPQQPPAKVARFAFKGLSMSTLVRSAARLTTLKTTPQAADLGPLMAALEGVELHGVAARDPATGQPVEIDVVQLSWGQFVGAFPTQARATLRARGPTAAIREEPFPQLAANGFTEVKGSLDIGMAWSRDSRTLVLSPGLISIDKAFTLTLRAGLANVGADMFSGDQVKTIIAATTVDAGQVEIELHDLGALDLGIAYFARVQGQTPDVARRALAEIVLGAALLPGLETLAEALTKFVSGPGQTLTVRLIPRERLPLIDIASSVMRDPMELLTRLRIEATTR